MYSLEISGDVLRYTGFVGVAISLGALSWLGSFSVSACAACLSLQVYVDSPLKLIAAVVSGPTYIPFCG